jgi:hypothetical protein
MSQSREITRAKRRTSRDQLRRAGTDSTTNIRATIPRSALAGCRSSNKPRQAARDRNRRLVAGVISVPLVVGDVLAGGWERPVEHQDAPETPGIDAFCNVDALDESWPCRLTIFHA